MDIDDDRVALGERLRTFRNARRMSLRDLSSRSGVSTGFISQIEKGQANASIPILRKIAGALGLKFVDLFEPTDVTGKVLKKADRPLVPTEAGTRNYQITRQPLQNIEVTLSEYSPGDSTGGDDYTHGDSQELVLILRGSFVLSVDGTDHPMEEGDSFEFRTSLPHEITNVGGVTGEALWVLSPPSLP